MSDWGDDEPVTAGRSFGGEKKGYTQERDDDTWGDENGGKDDAYNGGGGDSSGYGGGRGRGGGGGGRREFSDRNGRENGAEEFENFGSVDDRFPLQFVIPRDLERQTISKFIKYLPELQKRANLTEILVVNEYLQHVYNNFLEIEAQKLQDSEKEYQATTSSIGFPAESDAENVTSKTAEETTPKSSRVTLPKEQEENVTLKTAEETTPKSSRVTLPKEQEEIKVKLRKEFMYNLRYFGRQQQEAMLSTARLADIKEKKRKSTEEFWQQKLQKEPGLKEMLQRRIQHRLESERNGFGNLQAEIESHNENISIEDFQNADRRRVGLPQVQQKQQETVTAQSEQSPGTIKTTKTTRMSLRPPREQKSVEAHTNDETENVDKRTSHTFRQRSGHQQQRQLLSSQNQLDEEYIRLHTEFSRSTFRPLPRRSKLEQMINRCVMKYHFTFGYFPDVDSDQVDVDIVLGFRNLKLLAQQITQTEIIPTKKITVASFDDSSQIEAQRAAIGTPDEDSSLQMARHININTPENSSAYLPQNLTKQKSAEETPTDYDKRLSRMQSSTPMQQDIMQVPADWSGVNISIDDYTKAANTSSNEISNKVGATIASKTIGASTLVGTTGMTGTLQAIPEQSEDERTLHEINLSHIRTDQDTTLPQQPPPPPITPQIQQEQPTLQSELLTQTQATVVAQVDNNITEVQERSWFDILRSRNLQVPIVPQRYNRMQACSHRNRRRRRRVRPHDNDNQLTTPSNNFVESAVAAILPVPPLPFEMDQLDHSGVQVPTPTVNFSLNASPIATENPPPQSTTLVTTAIHQINNNADDELNLAAAQTQHENFLLENIESIHTINNNFNEFNDMMADYVQHCQLNKIQIPNFGVTYDPKIILEMNPIHLKTKMYILTELTTCEFCDFHRLSGLQTAEEKSVAITFLKELCSEGIVEIIDNGHKICLK